MMPTLRSGLVAAVAVLAAGPLRAETIPDGFALEVVAEGLAQPVALAYAPDGRLFVTEKNGHVRIVSPEGEVQTESFAEIEVYTVNENGLLGIALDPDFAENHYVYVFASISDVQQQIIRYTEVDGRGTDATFIREFLPGSESVHSGGCLKFGPDGKLYFSIGDTGERGLSQDLKTLAGKISRIEPDGATPRDNPFTTPTGSPRAVYALGFRNPFRFCFAPDGRMFVFDVGSDDAPRREEINIIRRGDNAGWPLAEGPALLPLVPNLVQPLVSYADKGSAITGGAYYTGTQFPAAYHGNLFHVEYVLHRIYRTVLDGDRLVSHELFWEGSGGPVDLVQAPDGSLVFSELFTGRVMRLRYTAAVEAPPAGDPAVQQPSESDPNEADPQMQPQPPRCGFGLPVPALAVCVGLGLFRFAAPGSARRKGSEARS